MLNKSSEKSRNDRINLIQFNSENNNTNGEEYDSLSEIQRNNTNINEELRFMLNDNDIKFDSNMKDFKDNPLLFNIAHNSKGKIGTLLDLDNNIENKLKYLKKLAFSKEQNIKLSTKLGFFKKIKQSREDPLNRKAIQDPLGSFTKVRNSDTSK